MHEERESEYRGEREGDKRERSKLQRTGTNAKLLLLLYIGFWGKQDLLFLVFVLVCILSNTKYYTLLDS